jgi:predicted Zn finger-like uncharacterized protein
MKSLSTTCPNCQLPLAVTPADLRAGQGYVRCGSCQRVFNALLSLSEDEDEEESFAPEPIDIEEPLPTETSEDLDFFNAFDALKEDTTDAIMAQPATPLAQSATHKSQHEDFEFDEPSTHKGLKAAIALLVLMLLVQLVHHHRRALITKPWTASIIGPVYAALGSPVEPEWNLAAYMPRQLGAEAPPFSHDQILVHASVQNRAPYAQPPPVLRVTLKDRFGNALTTHDVPPQNYLRTTPPPRLAPDQRLDAQLTLDDPGNKAVGFELDACLPGSDGRMYCAHAR